MTVTVTTLLYLSMTIMMIAMDSIVRWPPIILFILTLLLINLRIIYFHRTGPGKKQNKQKENKSLENNIDCYHHHQLIIMMMRHVKFY